MNTPKTSKPRWAGAGPWPGALAALLLLALLVAGNAVCDVGRSRDIQHPAKRRPPAGVQRQQNSAARCRPGRLQPIPPP
jgi:hypothetical protein